MNRQIKFRVRKIKNGAIKRKRLYNWHFWIRDWAIQIVIENGNYRGAIKSLEMFLSRGLSCIPFYEFQFGELVIGR